MSGETTVMRVPDSHGEHGALGGMVAIAAVLLIFIGTTIFYDRMISGASATTTYRASEHALSPQAALEHFDVRSIALPFQGTE